MIIIIIIDVSNELNVEIKKKTLPLCALYADWITFLLFFMNGKWRHLIVIAFSL